MNKRSVAREVAMKLVFSRLLGGEDTPEDVLEESDILEKLSPEDIRFAKEIAEGVEEHSPELDELVAQYAKDWSVERIGRVDLSVLRVAMYEILYRDDVPTGAAINEAVELAKRFGGDKSYSFVNGILGTFAKSVGQARQ